jgi:hypothetical protein
VQAGEVGLEVDFAGARRPAATFFHHHLGGSDRQLNDLQQRGAAGRAEAAAVAFMRSPEMQAVGGRLPAGVHEVGAPLQARLHVRCADSWRRRPVAVAGNPAAPAWWTNVGELGANRVRVLCARSGSFLCLTVNSLRAEWHVHTRRCRARRRRRVAARDCFE